MPLMRREIPNSTGLNQIIFNNHHRSWLSFNDELNHRYINLYIPGPLRLKYQQKSNNMLFLHNSNEPIIY